MTVVSLTPDLRADVGPILREDVEQVRAGTATRVIKRCARIALVLVLAAMGLALAASLVPRAFGAETLVVYGDSMGDAYPIGSVVVARPVPADAVGVGDVILVRDEGGGRSQTPVLHRVVETLDEADGPAVRTKGDANRHRDATPYQLPDRVPVASYGIPLLGYLLWAVQTPVGWAALVIAPSALFTAGVIVQIWASGSSHPALAWISWRSAQ